jgi:hypothetical protein
MDGHAKTDGRPCNSTGVERLVGNPTREECQGDAIQDDGRKAAELSVDGK